MNTVFLNSPAFLRASERAAIEDPAEFLISNKSAMTEELRTHFGMQPLCLFKHKLNQGTFKSWDREGISIVGRAIEAELCTLK